MLPSPSIRLLISLVVVVPIVVIAAALVALSTATNRRIAEDLGRELVDSSTNRVSAEVTRYLADAVRVSDLYAARIAAGRLPTRALQAWERPMLEDLVFSPSVASICFGASTGEATWLLRGRAGRLELGRVREGRNDHAEEFLISTTGEVGTELLRPPYHYDPRERPWYKTALTAANISCPSATPSATWTPVYFWFSDSGSTNKSDAATGSGYTRAVRSPSGELAGVLVIDVTLAALSDFLKKLPISEEGDVFLVDDTDALVASSEGPVVSPEGARLTPTTSGSDALRAAFIDERKGTADHATGQHRIALANGHARVSIKPIRPFPGVDWRVVAILPESAFLAEARDTQTRSILTGLLVAAAALVLGLSLSRSLAKPLEALSKHVRRVGSGDFEARLDLRAARELRQVSTDLNQMAHDLRQRLELEKSLEVAVQVQKSLLPESDPSCPGLDIAGRSRYCDAAGGDYFDFLDVSALTPRTTLLVVGDVMGHGISAALLMASARAALRARAADRTCLADVLTTVNRVLSQDARHNQFMTMVLTTVTPPQDGTPGTIRWASAGHDPSIIYHPADDTFEELEGGDAPLGVFDAVTYEQYTRAALHPKDILLIGTDGIWEMENPASEQYGKDRMRAVVRASADKSAADIAAALEADLLLFRGTAAPKDDVTFVIVKVA
ncbi:MAG: SpoIIE family protein phosphatase [Phycisphaerales bacterium]